MTRRHQLPLLFLAAAILSSMTLADARALECRYDVVVSDAIASELSVTIECDGGLPASFAMTEGAPAWAGAMTLSDGDIDIVPDGERWLVPPGTRDGTAQYTLALRAMAETMGHRYISAFRVGESIAAEPSRWLAIPEPTDDYTLSIGFEFPKGGGIATSMPFDGRRYLIPASLVRWMGLTAFGTFNRMDVEVPAPGALSAGTGAATAIDIVILGPKMQASTKELADWITHSGLAVAEFWGGFPVEQPLFMFVPIDGNAVTYGRVDSAGGTVAVIFVGRETEPADLYQGWVLIHEMLHLGSPYMRDTGAWLNEGIATFYEPIVRLRAGWKTREEVWREWIEWMPKGLRAMGEVGLVDAQGSGIYWGGALFLLLAEIEVRQRSNLALGVEDCVRAVRDAGYTRSVKWTTFKFAAFCDDVFGSITLSRLMLNHLRPGEPPDLDALWADLGVSMASDGTIQFDDTAPLAAVRDAILSGGPNAKWQPVPLRTE